MSKLIPKLLVNPLSESVYTILSKSGFITLGPESIEEAFPFPSFFSINSSFFPLLTSLIGLDVVLLCSCVQVSRISCFVYNIQFLGNR